MLIKDRIKAERKRMNLNQPELAKIMNTTKQTVSNWENGNRTPDASTLYKLAEFFDVSVDYLLGRTASRYSIQDLDIMFSLTLNDNVRENLPLDKLQKLLLLTKSKKNTMQLISYAEELKFNATDNVAYTIDLKDSNKQVKLTVDQIISLLNYFDSVGIDVEKSLEKSSVNSEKEND